MKNIVLVMFLCVSALLCSAQEISPYYITEYVYTANFDEIGTVKRSDQMPFKLKKIKGDAERFLYRKGETIKIKDKMVDKLFERDSWVIDLEVEVEKKIETVSFCIVRDEFNPNGVVARHGYCVDNAPQNSLQAFKKAVENNCLGSHLELTMLANRVVVGNTNGRTEATRLTFSEFLTEVTKQNNTYLFCELKTEGESEQEAEALVRAILLEVKQKRAQEWVYYLTSNAEVLKQLLRYEPEEFIVYTNDNLTPTQLKRMGCRMVAYDKEVLRANLPWMEEGRRVGVSISVKGANSREDMLFFLDNNVDNILTDRPDIMLKLVNEL